MKGKLLFEEEQSFIGTTIWNVIIGVTVLSVGGSAVSLLFTNEPEGYVGVILAVLTTAGIVILFSTSKLYVSIDQQNIYYRMYRRWLYL